MKTTVSQTEERLQDDLEQFITATVSQTEERLQNEIAVLHDEVADGFAGVSEAIEAINQHAEERDAAVDQKFMKLTRQAA